LGKAWRDLLQYLPLPRENIHFVRGDFPPEEAAEEYQGEIRIEELCQLGDRLSPQGLVEAFCALSRHRFYQNRSTGGRCWRLRQDFLFHSRIFMLR
jgi:hypothetical protein